MRIFPYQWSLVLILSFSSQALGYMPPAAYILDHWAKFYPETKKIQARLKFYPVTSERIFYQESLMYSKVPGNTSLISQLTGNSASLIKKTQEISLVSLLQWGGTAEEGIDALKKQGIVSSALVPHAFDQPTSQDPVQLKRWETTFAWVLGNTNQLWIEKDKFLPLKLIIQQKKDADRYEIQWSKYRFLRGYPYATEMKIFKNSQAFLVVQVESLEVNPSTSMPIASQVVKDSDLLRWYHTILR